MNIARRRVSREAVPPEHGRAVQAAKADWTQIDSEKILVVLEKPGARESEQDLTGAAMSGGETPMGVRLRYSPQRGLETGHKERREGA